MNVNFEIDPSVDRQKPQIQMSTGFGSLRWRHFHDFISSLANPDNTFSFLQYLIQHMPAKYVMNSLYLQRN